MAAEDESLLAKSSTTTVDTAVAGSYGSHSMAGLNTKNHHHHDASSTRDDDGCSLSTLHHPISSSEPQQDITCFSFTFQIPSTRRLAIQLSLYCNVAITVAKFIAYIRTLSLSVLAALLDSVLDVVSQIVLNYTEQHSSMQRSSAFYPAGASRLEPIGVLTYVMM